MTWETHPLTPDRFEDFADVINRTRRANHCWCLSHRLRAGEIEELGGGSREQAMRSLCERDHPPGVVIYRDGKPVGWCNIGPRTEISRLANSRLIRPIDDLPVWSIVCVVVRSGHRRQGVTAPLLEGAVAYAASHGAPAVEAHPVDPPGRMDLTMAFVGTKSMFERAGFRVVGSTGAVASGMPRLIMRRDLPAERLPTHAPGRPNSGSLTGTSSSTGSNCDDGHVTPVTRLVTFVDIDVDVPRQMSVSAHHEAVLVGGRRVRLLDDRGWSASGPPNIWAMTSVEDIVDTACTVVGPDEPSGGRSHEDMEADHWVQLTEVLRKQGVVADALELKRLPHEVVLSERLLARVGHAPGRDAVQP